MNCVSRHLAGPEFVTNGPARVMCVDDGDAFRRSLFRVLAWGAYCVVSFTMPERAPSIHSG